MKRLIRYKKNIVSLMCAVMVISIGIFSTSFDVYAQSISATREFYVGYPEPSTNDGSGYFCVVYRDSDYYYHLNTYFWNLSFSPDVDNHVSDGVVSMSVVKSGNKVTFDPVCEGDVEFFNWQFAEYTSSDVLKFLKFGNYDLSVSPYTYDYSSEGNIVACLYGGNVVDVRGFPWDVVPVIHWADSPSGLELNQVLNDLYNKLIDFEGDLSAIYSKISDIYNQNITIQQKIELLIELEEDILVQEKEQTSWLEKIWNSIQEFINPKSADEEAANDFNAESEAQKNEIDSLNQQNQTEKVDVNSATSQVDSNINYDNMAEYGGVLATITNNNYVLQMILIVVSVAIIAYVLFGKR